jgi:hypothetical protein
VTAKRFHLTVSGSMGDQLSRTLTGDNGIYSDYSSVVNGLRCDLLDLIDTGGG